MQLKINKLKIIITRHATHQTSLHLLMEKKHKRRIWKDWLYCHLYHSSRQLKNEDDYEAVISMTVKNPRRISREVNDGHIFCVNFAFNSRPYMQANNPDYMQARSFLHQMLQAIIIFINWCNKTWTYNLCINHFI